MQSDTPRVAIIGAGPGGLAAAVLLAARGCDVTVFEAREVVGGRSGRVLARSDAGVEYGFDMGPTFFLMPYVLDEIFAAAGKKTADYLDLRRLDPMYRLIIGRPGRDPLVLDTTQRVGEMARRIAEHAPADGPAFERFMRDNRRKLGLMESILRRPIRGPLDLVDGDTLKVLPMLKPHKSVHGLLAEYFTDEHVKLAVCFQSKYLGMSPFDCPSLFTILPFIEYEFGVWHPIGGCHAIMQGLARCARELGASIETRAPVEQISFEGRRATGVSVNGSWRRFDAVVANADASWAIKNLIPARLRGGPGHRQYADAALDAKRYSCSTYMLYLGVEGAVDLPHHTIYTSRTYTDNLADIASRGRLSEDPSVYVCNPSRLDPTLAPPGHSSLYVLVPTPNCRPGTDARTIDWAVEGAVVRDRAYAQLERVFGLADIRDRVRAERAITPDDWRGMNINHGATFNLAHNLGQMLHKRPQNRLRGFQGLYLVGGGTHPGSGLPTIFLSSQITVGLLMDDLGARAERPAGSSRTLAPSV